MSRYCWGTQCTSTLDACDKRLTLMPVTAFTRGGSKDNNTLTCKATCNSVVTPLHQPCALPQLVTCVNCFLLTLFGSVWLAGHKGNGCTTQSAMADTQCAPTLQSVLRPGSLAPSHVGAVTHRQNTHKQTTCEQNNQQKSNTTGKPTGQHCK